MQIDGSTILITGGSSGLGRAWAQAFHAAGARVLISGRDAAALEATAEGRPGMVRLVADLSEPDAPRRLAEAAVAAAPSLDAVLLNAGIMRAERIGEAQALADAEAMLTTNVLAPMRLVTALLPHLQTQPRATILTVSPGLAFVPMPATPAYSASKAAIHSWTQSLRHQLQGTAIEVAEIAPPMVATELMPGQSTHPYAMPLAEFTAETMALIAQEPTPPEILVERVKPMRFAEATGRYGEIWAMTSSFG